VLGVEREHPVPDDTLVYLAVAPCGCACAVTTEDGPDAHRSVGEWLHEGKTIERVPLAEAKQRIGHGRCPHEPPWGRPDRTHLFDAWRRKGPHG
jgi:hypothetical protein